MSTQNIDKQIAAMSDRAKERVRRLCRTNKSNVDVATHLDLPILLVSRIRDVMPEKSKEAGKRGTPDTVPRHQREPKWRSDEPCALDTRWNTDAVVGSRMLLVRMLETGTHWLNRERFRAVIDTLKADVAACADPRTDIRRRINCL